MKKKLVILGLVLIVVIVGLLIFSFINKEDESKTTYKYDFQTTAADFVGKVLDNKQKEAYSLLSDRGKAVFQQVAFNAQVDSISQTYKNDSYVLDTWASTNPSEGTVRVSFTMSPSNKRISVFLTAPLLSKIKEGWRIDNFEITENQKEEG